MQIPLQVQFAMVYFIDKVVVLLFGFIHSVDLFRFLIGFIFAQKCLEIVSQLFKFILESKSTYAVKMKQFAMIFRKIVTLSFLLSSK